jgi:cyclophilin family peptidyl-prolyl cis-trans isomerase
MHRNTALALIATLLLVPAAAAQTRPAEVPSTQPAPGAAMVYALMSTSKGDIVLELDPVRAPKSVANFMSYVKKGAYNGTIFHRVMSNFMIQGGGFNADMQKRPTSDPIKNEWRNGLKNVTGSIAMARLGRQPDSATSQFFINVKDNPNLDKPMDGAGYAVFGKVVAGMDVVNAIRDVRVGNVKRFQNVPLEPVVIREVTKIDAAEARSRIEAAGVAAPAKKR